MGSRYEVSVTEVKEVHHLPGDWTPAQLRQLLHDADFDDADQSDDSDLLELCLMTLQDLEHQLAGELVLKVVFGDAMRPGVRQNLVTDLIEDEPWSGFPEINLQRGLFTTMVLLVQAFPNRYATPDALQLTLSIKTISGQSPVIDSGGVDPLWLLQILAPCMADTDILNRLYGDEIADGTLPHAKGIFWYCDVTDTNDETLSLRIISSRQWLEPLGRGAYIANLVS